VPIQKTVLTQVKNIITMEQPDLCCLIEIDNGSLHSAYFNQIQELLDQEYRYFDISNKYGEDSFLRYLPSHKGNSNAFVSKIDFPFERFYFANGTKRLIHRIQLPDNRYIFFAHFSLNKAVRARQFAETNKLLRECPGEVILLADFNILDGFSELHPLLHETGLVVLNKEEEHTFTFHNRRLALDLCICSQSLSGRINLKVIPQPFSDHAAILIEI
jgi:endonuclease/exonuclease/phosphatase family metal-dependent hydrolase